MRWPLRYQIMWPMAALMLLTVIVIGGLGAWLSARASLARIESQITSVTRILVESNFPLTDAVLGQMKALAGADMVLVDARGRVLSSSGPAAQFAALLEESPAATDAQISLGDRLWVRNQGYFHTVLPIANRRGSTGGAMLHILYPEEEYRRAWQRAVYPSLGFIVLALPVAMLLAATTAGRISRRMSQLQGQVNRIAEGDFQQLALADRDDEIRALGQAVNRMAAMLADYEQGVRRTERMRTLAHLGGGIAHQLRNSATGAAMALDLHAEQCTAADANESLQVAKRQLRLMEEYIRRFLQLGKPPGKPADETIDLAALVVELLPLVQPAAQHAGIELVYHRSPIDQQIVGDSSALSQLVINLLLNAVEAAEQNAVRSNTTGRVQVDVDSNGRDTVTLIVSDTGAGPKESVKGALFEPFVTGKPDGVGLGLAVVREVVAEHAGRIRWERIEGMTRFIVELPIRNCRQPSGTSGEMQGHARPDRLAGPTREMQRAEHSSCR